MKNYKIKIKAIFPSKLDKHRLSKFASYPNRTKHYKATKSFLEVLLETAIESQRNILENSLR